MVNRAMVHRVCTNGWGPDDTYANAAVIISILVILVILAV